jgi:SAM-dependent methyltransferase
VGLEGDVLVVDESVDALELLRRETLAPNVFYLLGSIEVLPLTDASVDEVLATDVLRPDAAVECFRVLRPGGEVAIAAGDEDRAGDALNLDAREVERLFTDAGFDAVSVAPARDRLVVAARKP